jgi:uncharacterized protein (TIGR00369 family)
MSTDPYVTKRLDVQRIEALIDTHFPQIHAGGRTLYVEDVGPRHARVRMKNHARNVRPGGTVSGPAMFALADLAVYVAIMGAMGEAGLDAVTTNFNFNFLAKPEARDMLAEVRLLRLGRRSAVTECLLYSDGSPDLVAHATAGYAIPSSPSGKIIPSSR